MLTFEDFVTRYWKKARRSGSLWTLDGVAEEEGEDINHVKQLFDFCQAHGSLSDAELIALDPNRTPFGYVARASQSTGDILTKKVSEITVAELLRVLR